MHLSLQNHSRLFVNRQRPQITRDGQKHFLLAFGSGSNKSNASVRLRFFAIGFGLGSVLMFAMSSSVTLGSR